MFGHKASADAVVITAEMIHRSAVEHGGQYHHYHIETWRFVLEVRPPAAPAYRVAAEAKIPGAGFDVPVVGDTVRVEYHEKEPGKVELVLKGDERYDAALRQREEKKLYKADQASRDASFQAALGAPPGTPPADVR